MKSWFVSSLLLFAWSGLAWSGPLEDGLQCVTTTDLPCAREQLDELLDDGDGRVEVSFLQAQVLFHEGRFNEAAAAMREVKERSAELDAEALVEARQRGPADPAKLGEALDRQVELMTATAAIHEGLVETRIGDIVVVHHPGVERVLVEETVETLEQARARMAPLLGGEVPFPVRVEFYPDGESFSAASGLPQEAIRTTGVVAISKWNRLLLVSPRVRARGYGWKDTLVHEWVHMVVSYHCADRAPIWLQEGIAKATDMLWREDAFSIPLRSQSLLAGALQTGEWVTFEQMHPSMAYLPSADMAGLAYAQVSTMIEHLQRTTDREAIVRVLERVREGEDARDAVAEVANGGDFEAFEQSWRRWLATLELTGVEVAATPTVLAGPEDDPSADPVLSRRKDLANLTRLGQLMAQRDHLDAAMVYFDEAMPEDQPPGPLLVFHRAEVLERLGRPGQAIEELEENLNYYPEAAPNRKLLGQLLLARGQTRAALTHFRVSADIYPFDTEVQAALAQLYAELDQPELAARHQRYLDILFHRDTG